MIPSLSSFWESRPVLFSLLKMLVINWIHPIAAPGEPTLQKKPAAQVVMVDNMRVIQAAVNVLLVPIILVWGAVLVVPDIGILQRVNINGPSKGMV